MISMRLSSNKKNWEKIQTRLLQDFDKKLKIGFFKEDFYGPENDNLPVALVAAWQDRGAPFVGEKHIPARPFMTVGLRDLLRSPIYTNKYKKAFLDVLTKNSDFTKEYKQISVAVVPALQKIIDRWSEPPNAPFTISEKGFNDPLINTGKMRDSVKAKVE